MKKVLRIAAGVLVGLALAYGSVAIYEARQRPWRALRSGMSEDQVVSIMGAPDLVLSTDRGAEWWYPGGIQVRFHQGGLSELRGGKAVRLRDN